MIRTDHPLALAVVVALLLGTVVALESGMLTGRPAPQGAASQVENGTGADNATTTLTDSQGRLIAERAYEAVPARIERKRANLSRAHEIQEPTGFINAEDVALSEQLGEKVILVEVWTYGCYNCQNTHPYIKEYWREYRDDGLVVIGIHNPEFDYERDPANVREYVTETNTTYPVVLDNRGGTWEAYDTRGWPTRYLIGVDGFVRYEHFGEGAYEETDRKIRQLLAERDRVVNRTGRGG